MSPSRLPQVPPPAFPPLVAAYVKATNSSDLDRLLTFFADDAFVNDQLRDYWGKSAIREWAARDIIGEKLTMHVVKIKEHYGHFILTANVDGNYDKRGLPH
jgi:ketosteroid isomerase-like protein